MFKRLFGAIESILLGPVPGPRGFDPYEARPVPDLPELESKPDELEERLAFLAQASAPGAPPFVAGALEFVGLDDVRAALGERWRSVSKRVIDVTRAEIEALLGPGDLYRQVGETSFVLFFGNASDPADADSKASAIGEAVRRRLAEISEIGTALSVGHFVAAIDQSHLASSGASLCETLLSVLRDLRGEVEQKARHAKRALMRDFQMVFAPVWHTQKHLTVLNRSLIDSNYGCTTLAQFQALADPDQMQSTFAELDFLVLTRTLEAVHELAASGRSAAFLVPVSFETLNSRETRLDYKRLLSEAPQHFLRCIIPEITGIPETASASRILELEEHLRPHVRTVAIELPMQDSRLEPIANGNVWGISVNLSGASSIHPQLQPRLRHLVRVASAGQVNTLAHDANSIGLALAAMEAGLTFIDGPAIQAPGREPRPPTHLSPLQPAAPPGPHTRRW